MFWFQISKVTTYSCNFKQHWFSVFIVIWAFKLKCNSSSLTFEEHFVHSLLCRGTRWYLPNSICNLCEDVRSFVKLLLSSKLLTMLRYFSRPKLFLHILYIFNLLSENWLICFFHSVINNDLKKMLTLFLNFPSVFF